jgi:hypothetical protein
MAEKGCASEKKHLNIKTVRQEPIDESWTGEITQVKALDYVEAAKHLSGATIIAPNSQASPPSGLSKAKLAIMPEWLWDDNHNIVAWDRLVLYS